MAVSLALPAPAPWAAPARVIDPQPAGNISRAGGVAPLYPAGGDTAPNGTRYVADSGRSRIVRLANNGRQRVVSGAGWKDPRDLTVDASAPKKLWVLDTGNDRVVRVDTVHHDLEKVHSLGSTAGLTEAYGLTDDRSFLYVADTYYSSSDADPQDGAVVKLAKGSGAVRWRVRSCLGTELDRPRDVTIGTNGALYVADTDNDRIIQLNRSNGSCVRAFGMSRLDAPRSLTASAGGLWVTEGQAARIQKFRNGGSYVQGSAFGSFGTSRNRFRSPHCVFMDGNLVDVCDTFNFRIQRLRIVGGMPRYHSTLGGKRPTPGGFNGPFDVVYGPQGVLYVTDWFNHRVQKFDAQGDVLWSRGGYGRPAGSFIFPRGIALMDGGDTVIVTDSENNRLQLLSGANGQSLATITFQGTPKFLRPHQTAVDPTDGTFWVADTGNNRALHIDPNGNEIDVITSLTSPRGIAVDAAGNVYVADNGGVDRYTPAGVFDQQVAGQGPGASQVSQPYGLRIASLDGGPVLLIADRGHNRILIWDLVDETFLPTISGGLTDPQGADARGNGRVAVANFGRNRVSLWTT